MIAIGRLLSLSSRRTNTFISRRGCPRTPSGRPRAFSPLCRAPRAHPRRGTLLPGARGVRVSGPGRALGVHRLLRRSWGRSRAGPGYHIGIATTGYVDPADGAAPRRSPGRPATATRRFLPRPVSTTNRRPRDRMDAMTATPAWQGYFPSCPTPCRPDGSSTPTRTARCSTTTSARCARPCPFSSRARPGKWFSQRLLIRRLVAETADPTCRGRVPSFVAWPRNRRGRPAELGRHAIAAGAAGQSSRNRPTYVTT